MAKSLISLFFLFLLVVIPLSSIVYSASGKITVQKFSGSASYKRSGYVQQVETDMACKVKDVLKTNYDGEMSISMNGTVGFHLFPESQCVIVKASERDMRLDFVRGEMIVRVDTPSGSRISLEVETPSATVKIQDGEFSIKIAESDDGDLVTTFAVDDGFINVVVKGTRSNLNVREGFALDVPVGIRSTPAPRNTNSDESSNFSATSIRITPV